MHTSLRLSLTVLLALTVVAPVRAAMQAEHPLQVVDFRLQAALNAAVAKLGLNGLIAERRFAAALVDLSASTPRYAAVNGDEMMYAASLPKIAILLAAFDALEDGEITDTPQLRNKLVKMIRVSDNRAASDVLKRVGFAHVADTLTNRSTKLYDTENGGGLWIGKAYGRNDYWRRDPIANLSHGATARQVARYFLMLDHGELISRTASREMKTILGNPGIRHKFVRGLEQRPGAKIFRKSGTWRDYHADAALVERANSRYVAVGLVHDADGERILQRLIVAMDDIVRVSAPVQVAARR